MRSRPKDYEMAGVNALSVMSPDGGLSRYLTEIRKFPMLAKDEEFMLAKRWREHEDPAAAHRLVTSHLRLVAKIAMGYRGYGLPIGEVISEGNVGLMQAVKKFEPDKGFRLATYAMWWIRASIQEYILRSWSLVKMGTTAAQKKLFFNLRKAKSEISALEEGDMRPEQVSAIATKLGVLDSEVISMNRRLSGPDASLNAPLRSDSENEWQDWLEDKEQVSQETRLAEDEEKSHPDRAALARRPDDAGDPGDGIRRQPRAGAPDRSAGVRKAATRDARRGDRSEHGQRLSFSPRRKFGRFSGLDSPLCSRFCLSTAGW